MFLHYAVTAAPSAGTEFRLFAYVYFMFVRTKRLWQQEHCSTAIKCTSASASVSVKQGPATDCEHASVATTTNLLNAMSTVVAMARQLGRARLFVINAAGHLCSYAHAAQGGGTGAALIC